MEAALQEDFHPWAGGFSRADVWKLTEEIASTNVQMVWEVRFGWPRDLVAQRMVALGIPQPLQQRVTALLVPIMHQL